MKYCLFIVMVVLMALPCGAATIYQKWDTNGWTTSIGSGADPATIITPLPSGKHYLYTDLYRNNVNNGKACIYVSLGSNAIPAGTTAGNVTPFWLECDFRYKGGSSSFYTVFGLFNSNGDNDNNPLINVIGMQFGGSNVQGLSKHSGGTLATASISGGGTNVLHRIKFKVYNSGGKTLMNIYLYTINEETFETLLIGWLEGSIVMDTGQSLQQNLDAFGIRNNWASASSHGLYDFDNFYFSTSAANSDHPVPSFATYCVSSVLQSGSSYFDPWNATRWASWYSSGKLAKPFAIDCDVTLADRGGESAPWEADVSGLSSSYLFLIESCSRGKTFNGNNQFIDIRLTSPSLSTLYSWYSLYPDSDLFPLDYCFYCAAGNKDGVDETTITNLTIKGFVRGIMTDSSQTHPLVIDDVRFRNNRVGLYLHSTATTVQNCTIKASARSGMYMDIDSHDNDIINNTWQDNDYEQHSYYSDIFVDSSYGNFFEDNEHQAHTGGDYHVAVKLIRNMGEGNNLRENSAWGNTFLNNTVNGYSVGYEVGARMGENIDYDLSDESRDYAQYNLFQGNSISNTTVGIKLNTSGNEINGNTFSSVNRPILLHTVFYSLTETKIYNQNGTRVSYWFNNSDWNGDDDYADWFRYQDDTNANIASSTEYMHISYTGTPDFDDYSGNATLSKKTGANPSQIIDLSTMKDVLKSGGTPIDVAVGDFWVDSPGDEIAIIWSTAISNISGTNYYTISIYDSNGIEVNRCGRSTTKWLAITAGDFLDLKGQEIAAVTDAAVGGYYKVYIFGRGRKTASATLLSTNAIKITAIAGGNFNTATDSYDELAYVKSGATTTINYCKPTDTGWSATTTGVVSAVDLVGGNFDGNSTNGDEVAVMHATYTRAYLYKVGATTYYNTAGPSSGSAIKAIAAGNFDTDSADEVALALATATSGEYPITCYNEGATTAFKTISQNVQGVSAKAIAAGTIPVGATLGIYERAQGFTSANYGSTMANWGECVIMLPSAAQTTAIPAFILNADPTDSNKEYLKVTPIVR